MKYLRIVWLGGGFAYPVHRQIHDSSVANSCAPQNQKKQILLYTWTHFFTKIFRVLFFSDFLRWRRGLGDGIFLSKCFFAENGKVGNKSTQNSLMFFKLIKSILMTASCPKCLFFAYSIIRFRI